MSELTLRRSRPTDLPALARMNLELIHDEGGPSSMSVAELEARIGRYLHEGFVALVFEVREEAVGYALFRTTSQYVYLRHFYVARDRRGNGLGTEAFAQLRAQEWDSAASVQVDVRDGNKAGKAFWDSLGFEPRFVRLALETARKSKVKRACGAVVYRGRFGLVRFLLIHQVDGDFWGFPKGHANQGESEHETAYREVLEETGLRVRLKPGFCERIHYLTQGSRKKEVAFFLSRVRGQSVRIDGNEIDGFRWLSYDRARRVLPYENLRLLLDKAYSYITTHHVPTQDMHL